MKKPILIISTDWHLKPSNIETLIDLIKQKIKLAKSLKCSTLICLGDILQSRQSQPLSVLKCFETILDLIFEAGMTMLTIPGNHSKTNYSSEDSFLDQFKHHPALELIRNYEAVDIIEGFRFHFIPFFEENKWMEYFNQVDYLKDGKNILMSHQALTGSVNNDGTKVENSLKVSTFKDFYKVFLGHYHDKNKIGKNIYHLPSIQANNFGETNEKGFTVLYDDGSHELIKSNFKEYHTIKINLDKASKKEVNELKKKYTESDNNIRIKFRGSEEKVKSIKKEEFSILGIDIMCEVNDAEYETLEEVQQVELTKDNIKDEFKDWCDKKEKDYDTGIKYINKKFVE